MDFFDNKRTGANQPSGLDYKRGFVEIDLYHIDAPERIPAGSTRRVTESISEKDFAASSVAYRY